MGHTEAWARGLGVDDVVRLDVAEINIGA